MNNHPERRRHTRFQYPGEEGPYLYLNSRWWHYVHEISVAAIVIDSPDVAGLRWEGPMSALIWFPMVSRDTIPLLRAEGANFNGMSTCGIFCEVQITTQRTAAQGVVFQIEPGLPEVLIQMEEQRIKQHSGLAAGHCAGGEQPPAPTINLEQAQFWLKTAPHDGIKPGRALEGYSQHGLAAHQENARNQASKNSWEVLLHAENSDSIAAERNLQV